MYKYKSENFLTNLKGLLMRLHTSLTVDTLSIGPLIHCLHNETLRLVYSLNHLRSPNSFLESLVRQSLVFLYRARLKFQPTSIARHGLVNLKNRYYYVFFDTDPVSFEKRPIFNWFQKYFSLNIA